MNTVLDAPDVDLLGVWVATRTQRVRHYGRVAEAGLRFAFYGRVSTEDYQDPVSSRRWQFDLATELVAGRGRIGAEFFDVGYAREIGWGDRPQGARLLAAVADPDRGFEAIVVGEFARAFYGSQAMHLAPLLKEYGVQLWLPEVDGPVDLDSPTHQALLLMLGAQARRRCSGRDFAPLRRCRHRPGSRAAVWAVGHRTGIALPMPGRISTARTRGGEDGCTAWSRTRRPHRG